MSDLLSDLQADLAAERPTDRPTDRPDPAGVPAQRHAALPTAPLRPRTTPAFELRVTPLRWSAPALGFDGGVCLRVGPVQVGIVQR